jgi:hypothetical protein
MAESGLPAREIMILTTTFVAVAQKSGAKSGCR